MGFYLNFASLGLQDRSRRCNVIPLTLDCHGSKFENIVSSALGGLQLLDRGMNLSINGETKFVCAYTLVFTGDMPQQKKNKGFKEQSAKLGCRFCVCPNTERGNLTYNVCKKRRYHFAVADLRQDLMAKKTQKLRNDFCIKHDIN